MEAIKNLRESSVLLSNTGIVSYSAFAKAIIYYPCIHSVEDGDIDVSSFEGIKMVVENCARYACIDLLIALDKWAVEDEYRVLFDAMMAYRSGTLTEFLYSEYRDAEPSGNDPQEEQARELSAIMSNNEDTSEEKMILGTTYKGVAEAIYNFGDAQVMACRKPSDDLDIEFAKEVVLGMANIGHTQIIAHTLRDEAADADYRGIYRELYILLQNDIADIDEDICLRDGVPYSIEMCDGHRVVCPHFEQIIEADEVKEAAFISDEFEVSFDEETGEYNTIYTGKSKYDEDFDLILDEETGKVKLCRDHTPRLTEEDYEEMERLEADDNFHASLYEADCLPF